MDSRLPRKHLSICIAIRRLRIQNQIEPQAQKAMQLGRKIILVDKLASGCNLVSSYRIYRCGISISRSSLQGGEPSEERWRYWDKKKQQSTKAKVKLVSQVLDELRFYDRKEEDKTWCGNKGFKNVVEPQS